ncbi:MAG TPA: hypothetical protein VK880_00755 [Anaerolineales bacterium]|nr:hypothetical protein [Anaerolineales bacterium]
MAVWTFQHRSILAHPFSHSQIIQANKSPEDLLEEITGHFEVLGDDEKILIEKAAIGQLKQMLLAGILVIDEKQSEYGSGMEIK